MSEAIKSLIKSKKPDIDELTLNYFTNYFSVVCNDELLPKKVKLEDVIENTLNNVNEIVFYDSDSEIFKKLGPDVKGYRDIDNQILYVRSNLGEPLREITIYHEIHHAAQTNSKTGNVGINQEDNKGRLIMEGQTQYMAEKVYTEVHGLDFEVKEYPTEELRMLAGGRIYSSLHNYQMYDNLLTKLAIILNVSKDYFVTINYLYDDNEGLELLEKKYNASFAKYELPKDFNTMLFDLDYIYVVDYMGYIKNYEKDVILEGKETVFSYEIYKEQYMKLSLKEQMRRIIFFDRENLFSLLSNEGNYGDFAKYIIDDKTRKLIMEFIGDKKLDITTN